MGSYIEGRWRILRSRSRPREVAMKNPFRSQRSPSMEDVGQWLQIQPSQVRCSGFSDFPQRDVLRLARSAVQQHLAAHAEIAPVAAHIGVLKNGQVSLMDHSGWAVTFHTSQACVGELASFLREFDPRASVTSAPLQCVLADEEDRIIEQTFLARHALQSSSDELPEEDASAGPSLAPAAS